jgi:hypothetical protein
MTHLLERLLCKTKKYLRIPHTRFQSRNPNANSSPSCEQKLHYNTHIASLHLTVREAAELFVVLSIIFPHQTLPPQQRCPMISRYPTSFPGRVDNTLLVSLRPS